MVIGGNVIRVSVGDTEIDCQLDATFTSTTELTANPPCKGGARAQTQTVSSTSWTITFNGKTLLQQAGYHQIQLLEAQKLGQTVEVAFASKPGEHSADTNFLIEGNAYISEISIEAPAEGESTYSATFTGDGEWTLTETPVV